MKKITLDSIIKMFQFLYILSIYLLTYRVGLNSISNGLALILVVSICIKIILTRKKLVINNLLIMQLVFILVCLTSIFVSISQITVITKVRTLFLIFMVMLVLINYIDSYEKIHDIIKHFVYAGFIASIYILATSDFSVITRYGGELGNQNAVGMSISISCVFCFYTILKERKYKYVILLITMIPCVLLTGSRKALLFIVINIILIFYFKNRNSIKNMFKFLILLSCTILIFSYIVFNIPFFYEIIGDRMENLFSFVNGQYTSEGSINVRADMTIYGFELFKSRPIIGYGIDNFRYLYGGTYSHNNFIELMVGTGVFGAALFYLIHTIIITNLTKLSKNCEYAVLCYAFISIIISYIILSPSFVYYDNKHFSYILAIASTINLIQKKKDNLLTKASEKEDLF